MDAKDDDNCAQSKAFSPRWQWLAIGFTALFWLLWGTRLFAPDFLAGPLIPCLAIALAPGCVAALALKNAKWSIALYRIGLAAGLLIYLLLKKTIAPEQLFALLERWEFLVGGILLLGLPILVTAWRWRLLLRGQKITVAYLALCRVTLVSYFFNTFVPGSNGGDVYRIYELAQKREVPTAVAATTVILDHFLGLPALMLCVLIGVACNFNAVGDSAEFVRYHYFVRALGIAALLLLVGFFALLCGSMFLHSFTAKIEKKIPGGAALVKITAALAQYRQCPRLLTAAGGISLLMHLATLSAFILFGISAGIRNLDFSQYLFLVFAGLSINYLPLSPGGIGVGELGFATVFQIAPPFSEANGAAAAAMMISYRVAMLFYGAVGWGIYLAGKQRIADAEIEVENENYELPACRQAGELRIDVTQSTK